MAHVSGGVLMPNNSQIKQVDNMNEATRRNFTQYTTDIARRVGRQNVVGESFNYDPTAQQRFYEAVGEQADFLNRVNQITVEAQVGQKIGLGIRKPIASRTNTDLLERKTRYVGEQAKDPYHAQQTNYDTHLSYRLMASWQHVADFAKLYTAVIAKQVARDRLLVGWHGEHAAEETDIDAFPMLQDVNEGWLAKVANNQPQRMLGYNSDGTATTDTYKLGEGGQYRSLDALVFDMTNNLMDAWHVAADDLVVMVGREIWVDHGMALLSSSTMPTERNALQTWFAAKTVAGLPSIQPPFLPARSVIVTSYDNLSIYHQSGTLRRSIIDNPKRDRVEEYMNENEAYVVEDYGKFAGVRQGAILLQDGNGGWR
jgi:P2 family phage major capsid protein